ncbi:MAG: Gfo/Idh/MocA family oxidoreductase [Candidatus Omnitrophica bacterium]|nr:Gfo/Idh/MocA family oxidoreductase [Candidatus Omnitrophota bacterium]
MKILMAGLGSIGQRHLRNILSILGEDAEISAYRVRKGQEVFTDKLSVLKGARLEEEYKFRSFDSLDEALAGSPEAVFICNPTSMHIPVALAAAKKGCHLFIEKPLSHDLEGIEELESIVREKGLTALVGFQLRFHPCYLKLKELIAEERAGNILSAFIEVGEFLPAWHKWEDYRRMYASRKDLGGGVVLTQIHEIDYAMDIFGAPQRICAAGGHLSSLDIDVEDTVDALMEFSHKGRRLPVSFHMDYLQRPPRRGCRIIGEDAIIAMDLVAQNVVIINSDGKEERFEYGDFSRNQLFIDEIKHFFACIRAEEKPLVDISTALQGMKTAMAVKESMNKRKKVLLKF